MSNNLSANYWDKKLSKILSLLGDCNVFIWCKSDEDANCGSQQYYRMNYISTIIIFESNHGLIIRLIYD